MTYQEAMEAVKRGYRVRRKAWTKRDPLFIAMASEPYPRLLQFFDNRKGVEGSYTWDPSYSTTTRDWMLAPRPRRDW